MKLKNYILCAAALSFLFSCSDNEPILDKPVETATTLSLVTTELQTRADNNPNIENLVVAIYNADGTAVITVDPTENPTFEIDGVDGFSQDIAISPGNHKVLVLANIAKSAVEGKSLTTLLTTGVLTLDNEGKSKNDDGDEYLTMSSKVIDVTFYPNVRNLMGHTTAGAGEKIVYQEDGGPIKLYRHLSTVELTGIALVKKTPYGKGISFKLKEVFMANVKSQSRMVADWSTADLLKNRSVEVNFTDVANWWYGNVADMDGYYKGFEGGTVKAGLLSSGTITDVTLDRGNPETPGALEGPMYTGENNIVAGPFKVYENELPEANGKIGYQTLLVVKGDYTYIPDGEVDEVTVVDKYYSVPINNAGTEAAESVKGILRPHFGIIRNNNYTLTMGINGPGSNNPYQPDAFINVNAEIRVADWTQVVLGGDLN